MPDNTTSALDAEALLLILPTLLPRSTSSPLPHPTDSVAALVHTIHTQLGFRLLAVPGQGSSQPCAAEGSSSGAGGASEQDASGDNEDDDMSETTTAVDPNEDTGSGPVNVLPAGWNARGEDSYSFEYRHEQSSMVFRVRVGRMGTRVTVDGMAEDSAPHSFSSPVSDVVDAASFPIPSAATAAAAAGDEQDAAKALGFVSRSA